MILLLLAACAGPPAVVGKVVDIWGNPVPEATVVIEGVVEMYHADQAGLFRIETEAPVTRVMAGKPGFIKDVELIAAPPAEGEDYAPMTFQLYPEPEKPGFYAVGHTDYVALAAQRIVMVGTELKHYAGLRDIPGTGLGRGKQRFVFTSKLRPSDLMRMNLHLSKLSFVSHTPVKGLLGPMDATVNLWIAEEDVPFDLEQLPSRDDYLISTRGPLDAGMYAFHAQDVLAEQDERVFLMLPKEMQVAFPFEVNGT